MLVFLGWAVEKRDGISTPVEVKGPLLPPA